MLYTQGWRNLVFWSKHKVLLIFPRYGYTLVDSLVDLRYSMFTNIWTAYPSVCAIDTCQKEDIIREFCTYLGTSSYLPLTCKDLSNPGNNSLRWHVPMFLPICQDLGDDLPNDSFNYTYLWLIVLKFKNPRICAFSRARSNSSISWWYWDNIHIEKGSFPLFSTSRSQTLLYFHTALSWSITCVVDKAETTIWTCLVAILPNLCLIFVGYDV
jgi:hypothetical protein